MREKQCTGAERRRYFCDSMTCFRGQVAVVSPSAPALPHRRPGGFLVIWWSAGLCRGVQRGKQRQHPTTGTPSPKWQDSRAAGEQPDLGLSTRWARTGFQWPLAGMVRFSSSERKRTDLLGESYLP